MRVTNIRNAKDSVLASNELRALASQLRIALIRAGFLTDVEVVTSSGLNISNGQTAFRVDTALLGWNAKVGYYDGAGTVLERRATSEGFQKTSLPTWDQRVAFCRLVNDVLDSHRVTASVLGSGAFVVRTPTTGAVRDLVWDPSRAGIVVEPMAVAEKKLKAAETELQKGSGKGPRYSPTLSRYIRHAVEQPDELGLKWSVSEPVPEQTDSST